MPGTAYLKRRQASLRGREQARRLAVTRAEEIHAALSSLAAASRRHRAQDPQLSGRDDWMLLNGAYLVDEGRDEEFAAMASTLGGDGVDLRLTGPWAPYSFTILETS
ncbi:GvpL/GvpF family gas vesicle protein [Nonomuraea sp. K274]|uniref:GvpL/GvpF family gas vesicle protein n=2 Tax=Nonomuraea cypriaca TaxID=1187855 RepID=A0A931EZP4_9ACTN|nr:GvpL/GvpF family gas vesicle protein [Nonomuraea cypriaca]